MPVSVHLNQLRNNVGCICLDLWNSTPVRRSKLSSRMIVRPTVDGRTLASQLRYCKKMKIRWTMVMFCYIPCKKATINNRSSGETWWILYYFGGCLTIPLHLKWCTGPRKHPGIILHMFLRGNHPAAVAGKIPLDWGPCFGGRWNIATIITRPKGIKGIDYQQKKHIFCIYFAGCQNLGSNNLLRLYI